MITIQRRKFIAAFGGAVAAPPALGLRAAFGQQAEKLRHIGVLMGLAENNPDLRGFVSTFVQELAGLGWIDRRNVQIEQRWTNADVNRASALAKELVASSPDVILTATTPATAAVKLATSTIPIVFTIVSDPVGAGFVAGLPQPGGNITGFTHTDADLAGKWLDLLKEISPSIKRAGIMFNPDTASGGGRFFLGSFEAAARALAVEPISLPVRSDAEIQAAIAALGREQAALAGMDELICGSPSSDNHFLGDPQQSAGNIRVGGICQGRRPNLIRRGLHGAIPPRRRLRRSNPARRKTGRPSGADANEIQHGN